MDNFDIESNYSYQSDSLQSNASSLSGLSYYGNEFAELRHLVNPSKYPTPYLGRSSTPKAELTNFENEEEVQILKSDLRRSLELNEQYKNNLQNLEKQIELRFYNKIDKLLRNNTRLEGELENANNQIERIIQNSKEKNEFLVTKQKLDLEKKLREYTSANSSLEIKCASLNQEKNELDHDNKKLKITLGELQTEKEIKSASIESLKQKISEQHIDLENCKKNNAELLNKLSITSTKLQQFEKSKDWYKEELHQCQNNVQLCREETLRYKNQITSLNQKISSLNIEISKYKNDVDEIRLQALREKEELFKKLENIHLNCNSLNKTPVILDNSEFCNINAFSENNVSFYDLTIQDLKEEISRIKINIQEREDEFEKQKQENCELIAKCLVLQKSLQQNENSIELLENSKKELINKLQDLKESEKEKNKENLQLKNKITELDIELKLRNKEKQNVENSIKVIRDQFFKFKENYEKMKSDLGLKNKEILKLQNEKQELFMNNNWTICELEKTKEKDFVIEKLKRGISSLEIQIAEQTQKIRNLEFQIIKNDRIIKEKENVISEKIKELENYNTMIIESKSLNADNENKIKFLQGEIEELESGKNQLEENFKIVKAELKRRDLKLDKVLKNLEQLQNDHRTALKNISLENKQVLDDYKAVEQKYICELREKDLCISNLQNKLKKLENDCDNYIKRITDDQKVEILLNKKSVGQNGVKNLLDLSEDLKGSSRLKDTFNLHFYSQNKNFEKIIMNVFDNLNIEELESTVEIRLKHLDEKLHKIKSNCEEKMEKFENHYGRDKIKEMEILLQVKDRDMQDKQKKMDKNNRTLLRKVKEHMRGRNSAEKQLKYLQDLFNNLSDERNTLQLSVSSKEFKIQTLEKLCEDYKTESDKLRNIVLRLEKDLSKSKICEKCLELDELEEKLLLAEEIQKVNTQLANQLRCSEDDILQLTKKTKEHEAYNKSLEEKISILAKKEEECKTLLATCNDLQSNCFIKSKLIEELSQKLTEKEEICVSNYTVIEGLKDELEREQENVRSHCGKIEILSSELQQTVEYSEELLRTKVKLENDYQLRNTEDQKLIADLRNTLVLLQNEIQKLKSDKSFLQRLSNDLKVALQSYVEYNKNLKDQLNLVTKEKQQFTSLPHVLEGISISGKYDEKYINQLLKENSAPIRSPLTTEIQGCLSTLREEIFSLQDQIIKKNRVGN